MPLDCKGHACHTVNLMTKLIAVLLAAVALIQIIKPLGLPGLKRRQDAWKLAAGGAALMILIIVVTAGFKSAGM